METTLKENLAKNNVIFITSNLDEQSTANIIFNIMQWTEVSSDKPFNIYLSSQYNSFDNIITIYDVLEKVKNPISIFCIGAVGGFAILFLSLANNSKRYALKHTSFSLNQPNAVFTSGANQQTEVDIIANEATRQREILENILSTNLHKEKSIIHNDVEIDKVLTASEALEYGLIDAILE